MDKKGMIGLQTAIALILGVVFLVLVIFLMITTGLLGSFVERLNVTICTMTALSRGTIIDAIWKVWQIVMISLLVFEAIAFAGGKTAGTSVGAGFYKATLKQTLLAFGKAGAKTALGAALVILSISTIATYLLVGYIFPAIPLSCATTVLPIGYEGPEGLAIPDEFYAFAGSRTLDCWDMYGRGAWDPLWGVDPPNPRACFIFETHLKPTNWDSLSDTDKNEIKAGGDPPNAKWVTLKDLYIQTQIAYNKNWRFGTDKIFAYCGDEPMGNDPSTWNNSDCEVKNHKFYISYFDEHEFNLFSYGSKACDMENTISGGTVFDEGSDRIVWCLEEII